LPNIKIICDPSHIAGDRSLVSEVSQVAMDLGMDGLMIESHISPDDAWSDARQQISPEAVGRLMKELKFHTNVPIITNEELAKLREELDQLDGQIVDVLRKRMLIVKDIATIKEREGMSIFHMKRWMKLVGEHSNGSEAGLSDAFLKELFSTIHKYSVELQTSLIKKSK
jgi:chorismate mutase